MSFILSPAVEIREFDASRVVPAVATSIAGVCGKYSWGPCFERKTVTMEKELLSYFGLPSDTNFEHWFGAAEYLRYGNNLIVVRAVDADTAKNAGIAVAEEGQVTAVISIGTNPYIPNYSSIPTISFTSHQKLKIVARYPGILGNSKIKVALATADDFATAEIIDGTTFAEEFDYAPQSGAYDYYDQVAVAVLVKNDLDENWQILERWLVDLDPTAKDIYGKSNYIETVINQKSQYIYVFDNTSISTSPLSFEATLLSGGVDGDPASGDIQLGYDLLANPEEVDVNILLDGGNVNETIQGYIIDIAQTRKDCIAVVCVPTATMAGDLSTAVTACVTYKTTTLNKNNSYYSIYANSKYAYDKYNDSYRWLPMSADAAGCMAYTDQVTAAWFPPAGYSRGQVKNCIKLLINPTRAYRDILYKNNINPIVSPPGDGTLVFGQKTGTSIPSAYDRVNVRRLFIVLEKSISTAAKYMLFEFNDDYQRNMFKLMVDPFLKRIKSGKGIYDYVVICDSTNNTAQVIDSNEFVGDIYIKPARAAEFIRLNFTAVGTGVNFDEILRT